MPRKRPTDEEWLRPKEAIAILNVSYTWLRDRWDEFDAVQLSGGAYRVPRSALDRYLESRRVAS